MLLRIYVITRSFPRIHQTYGVSGPLVLRDSRGTSLSESSSSLAGRCDVFCLKYYQKYSTVVQNKAHFFLGDFGRGDPPSRNMLLSASSMGVLGNLVPRTTIFLSITFTAAAGNFLDATSFPLALALTGTGFLWSLDKRSDFDTVKSAYTYLASCSSMSLSSISSWDFTDFLSYVKYQRTTSYLGSYFARVLRPFTGVTGSCT